MGYRSLLLGLVLVGVLCVVIRRQGQLHLVKEGSMSIRSRLMCLRKMPLELLGSVSRDLSETLNKLRSLREHGYSSVGLLPAKQHSNDLLVGGTELEYWGGHDQMIYGDCRDAEVIEDDENSFGRTLGDVASWG